MTHDLLKNVLLGLQAHVQKVVVTGIKDETFYAVIWVDREGELVSIDSRPSDAFALALRIDCPIFVEDAVLKASKANASGDETGREEKPWLENLNDEDFGKYKM
jgi:bifunctional DNase/RNase